MQGRIGIHGLAIDGCINRLSGEIRSDKLEFIRLDIPITFIKTLNWVKSEVANTGRVLLPAETESATTTIQFSLGQKLGAGGSGLVYEVVCPPQSGQEKSRIPPLAVKIAYRSKNKRIAREAWFYEELQTLQGVVVPRCYGCFEARLPDDCTFTPWNEIPPEPERIDFSDPLEPQPEPVPDEEFFDTRVLGAFNEGSRELLTRLDDENEVTLLLLERLGEPFLPVGVPIPETIS